MKKIIIGLLGLIILPLMNGCINQDNKFPTQIVVSNLVDQISKLELIQALNQAGIGEKSIQQFFDNVDDFNRVVDPSRGLVMSGFVSQNIHGEYDSFAIQDDWNNQFSDFIGNNCRITSYGLINNLLTINKLNSDLDNEYIVFDIDALDSYPRIVFDMQDRQRFQTLYAPISTNDTLDQAEHSKKIIEYWDEYGIDVDSKNGASLIMVYFHDMINPAKPQLFIGHIGVLVPNSNGGCFFIEKIAFQEPYQLIKFENKKQVVLYLTAKYAGDYISPNESQPLIFENNKWMN